MKRDIKLNMAQLAETCYDIRVHKNNEEELRTACHVCLRVMERQKSESFEALSGQMRDVIIKMINDALHRMDDLEIILSEYIVEMKEHRPCRRSMEHAACPAQNTEGSGSSLRCGGTEPDGYLR